VGIEQFGAAGAAFADDRLDAGQRQFQLHWLGRGEHEQAALRGLRLHGVHAQLDPFNGRRGRMRRYVEPQQFQKRFSIERRRRQPQRAFINGAGFQMQMEAQLIGGEAACGQPCGEAVEQARQQEFERLQQLHRIFQLELFFESRRLFERKQLALRFPARQLAQAQSFRPQPLRDPQRRQRGQILKAAYAPALERFLQFRRKGAAARPAGSPGTWLHRPAE
jgi:hypothetical protein